MAQTLTQQQDLTLKWLKFFQDLSCAQQWSCLSLEQYAWYLSEQDWPELSKLDPAILTQKSNNDLHGAERAANSTSGALASGGNVATFPNAALNNTSSSNSSLTAFSNAIASISESSLFGSKQGVELFKVDKPHISVCPTPHESFAAWLEPGWDDVKTSVPHCFSCRVTFVLPENLQLPDEFNGELDGGDSSIEHTQTSQCLSEAEYLILCGDSLSGEPLSTKALKNDALTGNTQNQAQASAFNASSSSNDASSFKAASSSGTKYIRYTSDPKWIEQLAHSPLVLECTLWAEQEPLIKAFNSWQMQRQAWLQVRLTEIAEAKLYLKLQQAYTILSQSEGEVELLMGNGLLRSVQVLKVSKAQANDLQGEAKNAQDRVEANSFDLAKATALNSDANSDLNSDSNPANKDAAYQYTDATAPNKDAINQTTVSDSVTTTESASLASNSDLNSDSNPANKDATYQYTDATAQNKDAINQNSVSDGYTTTSTTTESASLTSDTSLIATAATATTANIANIANIAGTSASDSTEISLEQEEQVSIVSCSMAHPILLKPVTLHFNAKLEQFTLYDTEQPCQLYVSVLQAIESVEANKLAGINVGSNVDSNADFNIGTNLSSKVDKSNGYGDSTDSTQEWLELQAQVAHIHPLDRQAVKAVLDRVGHNLERCLVTTSLSNDPELLHSYHSQLCLSPCLFLRAYTPNLQASLNKLVTYVAHGGSLSAAAYQLLGMQPPLGARGTELSSIAEADLADPFVTDANTLQSPLSPKSKAAQSSLGSLQSGLSASQALNSSLGAKDLQVSIGKQDSIEVSESVGSQGARESRESRDSISSQGSHGAQGFHGLLNTSGSIYKVAGNEAGFGAGADLMHDELDDSQEPLVNQHLVSQHLASLGSESLELMMCQPLNPQQQEVVKRLNTHSLVLAQATAGTGKSYTAANLISQALSQGQKILVTAPRQDVLTGVLEQLPKSLHPFCGGSFTELNTLEQNISAFKALDLDRTLQEISELAIQRTEIFNELLTHRSKLFNWLSFENLQILYQDQSYTCAQLDDFVKEHADLANLIPFTPNLDSAAAVVTSARTSPALNQDGVTNTSTNTITTTATNAANTANQANGGDGLNASYTSTGNTALGDSKANAEQIESTSARTSPAFNQEGASNTGKEGANTSTRDGDTNTSTNTITTTATNTSTITTAANATNATNTANQANGGDGLNVSNTSTTNVDSQSNAASQGAGADALSLDDNDEPQWVGQLHLQDLPLSEDELSRLYATNETIPPSFDDLLKQSWPELRLLPQPTQFLSLLQTLSKLQQGLDHAQNWQLDLNLAQAMVWFRPHNTQTQVVFGEKIQLVFNAFKLSNTSILSFGLINEIPSWITEVYKVAPNSPSYNRLSTLISGLFALHESLTSYSAKAANRQIELNPQFASNLAALSQLKSALQIVLQNIAAGAGANTSTGIQDTGKTGRTGSTGNTGCTNTSKISDGSGQVNSSGVGSSSASSNVGGLGLGHGTGISTGIGSGISTGRDLDNSTGVSNLGTGLSNTGNPATEASLGAGAVDISKLPPEKIHQAYTLVERALRLNKQLVHGSADTSFALEFVNCQSLKLRCAALWQELISPLSHSDFDTQEAIRLGYLMHWVLHWVHDSSSLLEFWQAKFNALGWMVNLNFQGTVANSDSLQRAIGVWTAFQRAGQEVVHLSQLVVRYYRCCLSYNNVLKLLNQPQFKENPCCCLLLQAMTHRDPSLYAKAFRQMQQVAELKADYQERCDLLERLASVAPEWSMAIAKRQGEHGKNQDPKKLILAWQYWQFAQCLSQITSRSQNKLTQQFTPLKSKFYEISLQYIEKQASLRFAQSIQALGASLGIGSSSNGISTGISNGNGISTGIGSSIGTGLNTGSKTRVSTGSTIGISTGISAGKNAGVGTDSINGISTGISNTGISASMSTGESAGISTGVSSAILQQSILQQSLNLLPAWILPISQVLDNPEILQHHFDVLVIEQAQSVPWSAASLLLFNMAERVLLLGDEHLLYPSQSLIAYDGQKVQQALEHYALPNSLCELTSELSDSQNQPLDSSRGLYNSLCLDNPLRLDNSLCVDLVQGVVSVYARALACWKNTCLSNLSKTHQGSYQLSNQSANEYSNQGFNAASHQTSNEYSKQGSSQRSNLSLNQSSNQISKLMWTEQFTSMPQVLRYVNQFAYAGKLHALRVPRFTSLAPSFLFVPAPQDPLPLIMALLQACCEQAEYGSKSIGIMLLGFDSQVNLDNQANFDSQANEVFTTDVFTTQEASQAQAHTSSRYTQTWQLIGQLTTQIFEHISLTTQHQHNLRWGTPEVFTGEGCDVLFLVLGPYAPNLNQYTLALMQAHEQLWLVNSGLVENEQPERWQLLEYACKLHKTFNTQKIGNQQFLDTLVQLLQQDQSIEQAQLKFMTKLVQALCERGFQLQIMSSANEQQRALNQEHQGHDLDVSDLRFNEDPTGLVVLYKQKRLRLECHSESELSHPESILQIMQRHERYEHYGYSVLHVLSSSALDVALEQLVQQLQREGFYPENLRGFVHVLVHQSSIVLLHKVQGRAKQLLQSEHLSHWIDLFGDPLQKLEVLKEQIALAKQGGSTVFVGDPDQLTSENYDPNVAYNSQAADQSQNANHARNGSNQLSSHNQNGQGQYGQDSQDVQGGKDGAYFNQRNGQPNKLDPANAANAANVAATNGQSKWPVSSQNSKPNSSLEQSNSQNNSNDPNDPNAANNQGRQGGFDSNGYAVYRASNIEQNKSLTLELEKVFSRREQERAENVYQAGADAQTIEKVEADTKAQYNYTLARLGIKKIDQPLPSPLPTDAHERFRAFKRFLFGIFKQLRLSYIDLLSSYQIVAVTPGQGQTQTFLRLCEALCLHPNIYTPSKPMNKRVWCIRQGDLMSSYALKAAEKLCEGNALDENAPNQEQSEQQEHSQQEQPYSQSASAFAPDSPYAKESKQALNPNPHMGYIPPMAEGDANSPLIAALNRALNPYWGQMEEEQNGMAMPQTMQALQRRQNARAWTPPRSTNQFLREQLLPPPMRRNLNRGDVSTLAVLSMIPKQNALPPAPAKAKIHTLRVTNGKSTPQPTPPGAGRNPFAKNNAKRDQSLGGLEVQEAVAKSTEHMAEQDPRMDMDQRTANASKSSKFNSTEQYGKQGQQTQQNQQEQQAWKDQSQPEQLEQEQQEQERLAKLNKEQLLAQQIANTASQKAVAFSDSHLKEAARHLGSVNMADGEFSLSSIFNIPEVSSAVSESMAAASHMLPNETPVSNPAHQASMSEQAQMARQMASQKANHQGNQLGNQMGAYRGERAGTNAFNASNNTSNNVSNHTSNVAHTSAHGANTTNGAPTRAATTTNVNAESVETGATSSEGLAASDNSTMQSPALFNADAAVAELLMQYEKEAQSPAPSQMAANTDSKNENVTVRGSIMGIGEIDGTMPQRQISAQQQLISSQGTNAGYGIQAYSGRSGYLNSALGRTGNKSLGTLGMGNRSTVSSGNAGNMGNVGSMGNVGGMSNVVRGALNSNTSSRPLARFNGGVAPAASLAGAQALSQAAYGGGKAKNNHQVNSSVGYGSMSNGSSNAYVAKTPSLNTPNGTAKAMSSSKYADHAHNVNANNVNTHNFNGDLGSNTAHNLGQGGQSRGLSQQASSRMGTSANPRTISMAEASSSNSSSSRSLSLEQRNYLAIRLKRSDIWFKLSGERVQVKVLPSQEREFKDICKAMKVAPYKLGQSGQYGEWMF